MGEELDKHNTQLDALDRKIHSNSGRLDEANRRAVRLL